MRLMEREVGFRLLGDIGLDVGGQPVGVGGAKPKTLLAALLAKRGKAVETSALIDVVWGEDPPGSARGMIQTYVSAIRRAMQDAGVPDLLSATRTGYLIADGPYTLDWQDFEDAVATGRALLAGKRPKEAAETLRD